VPESDRLDLEEIVEAFKKAAGSWTGCDWPTFFGRRHLNLEDWTAAEAETKARELGGLPEGEDWQAAAKWLAEVECRAAAAEAEGSAAVAAASAGKWLDAVGHSRHAWAMEFDTGRPFRHFPATWQPLHEVIEATARVRLHADTRIQKSLPQCPA
jgi:hypothetical protein